MRYFKYENNARTMTRTGRPLLATGTDLITRSLRGFGQTDPVLDEAPGGDTTEAVVADAAAEALAPTDLPDPLVVAPPPVSTIQFYLDGTTIQRGVVGNTLAPEWWDKLETALGTPSGEGRTAGSLLQMADSLQSGKSVWKWATIIGVPVVGIAAFIGGRAMGRRGK